MTIRESLLAQSLKREAFEFCGQTVYAREMDGAEFSRWAKETGAGRDPWPDLLKACIVDEDGNAIFEPEDNVMALPGADTFRAARVISRLSGLLEDAKSAEGNSGKTTGGSSS